MDCTYCDGTGTAPLDGYPVRCLHCHGTGEATDEPARTETYHFAPGREHDQGARHTGTFAACQHSACITWRLRTLPL